ncbi:arylamine N-acetyltransferase, pineal gland isozyme NAT-10-like [Syngnathoides biaculeatus]|uniref:arylamine N-acetyltransferase, pineal gland isozyme NAT-10-like n=1 Tax=Syngnathoides biaculeatus TaxID=300417 RepID=UPI002ADDA8BC|nr:arylamine N-acetyltransferase, pineal gland isozyme NAT-10-like [Syngnathoides biaculeatus]XP_061670683.1 arylamine N-acetyltransferase, pineal gland isozyme NAT-10-like [Syngnathoides biaculeatus]XP_061670684.1 arylamine N-acetyltransferase, pineal gland isozyme NAT-10-like [Syngnathoides biaculeatus]XP_061670685.1 arylamine N-acetyltransferase, pineal gland isozyme NAT-10-like [Syngnathoides biaculeatus]XP_061670686.1 arylamine N-acetyltransferase, pineal gland isozyme NAT-10-like [Syngnat
MNLEEYFQRIGFQAPRNKADFATLKLIHRCHIMSICFENLDMHCGGRMVTDIDVIFDKIVRRGRGGWCMENNLLLSWVLREMGYDVTVLAARVFNRSIGDFSSMENHLINRVVLDGKSYIEDVSFGVSWQLWEPLELVSGKDQVQVPGTFRLTDKHDLWVLEKTGRKPEILNPDFANSNLLTRETTRTLYCFNLTPRDARHFTEANHILQTDPTSLFINKSICSLQTPTGFRALIGWTYSEVTFQAERGVDVYDMKDVPCDEIESLLREKFNIRLPNKLQPVNNPHKYTL